MGGDGSSASLRGLYAITPDLGETAELVARVEAALEGGVRWVQYRNKQADAALAREQARVLLAICRRTGASLIVNDDPELAAAIGADGVHLGAGDGDVVAARRTLGSSSVIGVSCYNSLSRAIRAADAGADYVAFGAMYPSSVKPQAVRASLELLAQARKNLEVPIAAIGGITLASGAEVIAAGADLLAVISDLFEAGEGGNRAAAIRGRASDYQRLFA